MEEGDHLAELESQSDTIAATRTSYPRLQDVTPGPSSLVPDQCDTTRPVMNGSMTLERLTTQNKAVRATALIIGGTTGGAPPTSTMLKPNPHPSGPDPSVSPASSVS